MSAKHGIIGSVGDFLNETKTIAEVWFSEYDLNPWYRGQSRASWLLRPSLYRLRNSYEELHADDVEDETREDFIVKAPALSDFKLAGSDEWEWCFLMQHYGAPTRLLDWTEGALFALYFAVKDNPGHFDSAVWMLDPYRLNKRAFGTYEVIPPSASGTSEKDRRKVRKWLPPRFRPARLPTKPIAVFPTHIARRISTQRSCFTVHGRDYQGLDRLQAGTNPILQKLVIPSFSVLDIKRELNAGGIDETSIFPDLDGLGRALAEAWEAEPPRPHENTLTILRPSKASPGDVGVFAILPIKKGDRPFRGENEEIVWFDKKQIAAMRMPSEVRKLYREFTLERDGRIGCPVSFNRLSLAWFLREGGKGRKVNVRSNEYFQFYALRDISAGEELIADFS
jgi:hypothetical protein